MKQLEKVYGRFQLLRKNKEQGHTKVAYTSLDKYNKSPYLQILQHSIKKNEPRHQGTPLKMVNQHLSTLEAKQDDDKAKSNPLQLPKLVTPIKYKAEVPNYFKTELDSIQNPLIKEKSSAGSHSATLQVHSTNKKRLQPLHKSNKIHYVTKSKAGTTGKQAKINQDIAIIDIKLPFEVKLFCVCDGHGLNGHLVSAFIKSHLLKNLNSFLKKLIHSPTIQELKHLIHTVFAKTNHMLLQSEINTELSGSTVIAVFLYQGKVITFNVGDSRAIMARQVKRETNREEEKSQSKNLSEQSQYFKHTHFYRSNEHEWQVVALSDDQKPDRIDEKERIINFGGRVFSQKSQKGEDIGPLRVWMKDVQMPGLAMTRSFGDKAGMKAGTNGQPQVKEFDITQQDKFIVIASDGIWQYLQNDEVMTLTIPFFLQQDLDLACERLIKISTQIWHKVSLSRDDITAIVVSLHSPANRQ